MLRRLLTAAVLLPLTVAAILGLPTVWLALPFVLVTAGAGWEWARLTGLAGAAAAAYAAAVAAGVAALLVAGEGAVRLVAWLALAWWLAAAVLVVRYPGPGRMRRAVWGWRAAGLLVLVPACAAALAVHGRPGGAGLLLYLLVVVWAADSGAYLVGRRWGRHRLIPRVSPGKTWEGLAGGVLAAMAAALAAAAAGLGGGPSWFALTLAVALSSVVGDLLESLVKRERGVKDSGGLLPGHGGLLDRIDSITAAAPVYLVGLGAAGGGA
ncbi:phosphatidate cytidylyltransferase [Inmirania thermothiophila]|uniref:Phosphatidate cytidylyltransferase n=1 Tax=Inmirania thermothiophila TaxID=1750597 RepID=A0A3N1Y074_9GAMM|nr:phosphatidate cytidylyltransferase [Inmirania thermothiophila]ROR32219.1 phosphatidate cytidylyltransferase [Inmirania thermothiophila]